ncbi:MAG: GAF domain-containing protein, partial [Candidatus Competibacteraceae bacterium]|nr:GAF domain-containing protein [Candidatus Competibacteraceae bacterium]
EVLQIEAVPCPVLALATPPRSILSALKQSLQSLTRQSDLSTLLDQTLLCLSQHFDIQHALLLMLDETGQCLYTVASHGYPVTGVGSEIALGQG